MQHPVPVNYYDSNDPFGSTAGRRYPHTGSDYSVGEGSTVESVADAVVYHTGFNAGNGNYVCCYIPGRDWDGVEGGLYVAYLHLSEIYVSEGSTLVQGQAVGLSGNTGTNSRGPHLHVTFSNSDRAMFGEGNLVNPFEYIQARLGSSTPTPSPTPAPSTSVDYTEVQSLLAARGYYGGEIDGQFGPQSWRAVQTLCADFGFYDATYIDGDPGRNTYIGMQMYAAKNGNYGAPDGEIGPKTWAGFTQSLREDAPKPAPTPIPTPTPEPVKPTPAPEKPEIVVPEKPEPVNPPVTTGPTPGKPDVAIPEKPIKPPKPTRPSIPTKPSKPKDPVMPETKPLPEEANNAASDALGILIPQAKNRKLAYALYGLTALVVSNISVGIMAAGIQAPVWVIVASAIVGNLAVPFTTLAIANAGSTKK